MSGVSGVSGVTSSTDAVGAIAITLLIVPLVDSVPAAAEVGQCAERQLSERITRTTCNSVRPMDAAKRPAPHDALSGPNDDIRNFEIEVLSDHWYTLRRATFDRRQPDGSWKPESREAYDRGNGACALLRDAQRNTVLLVRQYRLPAHVNEHPDGMLIEVPGGLVDAEEGASEAMRRELEEEVGHDIDDLQQVFSLYMSPGSVTEYVTFFVGTYSGASRVNAGGGAEAEGELVEVLEVPFDEALAMTADGRIVDGKTVLLLLWAKLNLVR